MNRRPILLALVVVAVTAALYALSRANYLLFHSAIEIASIAVAWAIVSAAWFARRHPRLASFYALGLGFFAVSVIDGLHTLAYQGMGVFAAGGTELATALWLAGRYFLAAVLVGALVFWGRPVRPRLLAALFALAAAGLVWLVFSGYFPVTYRAGEGLTPFKTWSEFLLAGVFTLVALGLLRARPALEPRVRRLLAASALCLAASELAFSSYVNVYGLTNVVGHLFKLGAYVLLQLSVVRAGLGDPYELLPESLRESERRYRLLAETVPSGVILTDLAGRIQYANPGFHQLLGLAGDGATGRTLADFGADEAWSAELSRFLEQAAAGEPVPAVLEAVLARAGGGHVAARLDWRTVPGEEGRIKGLCAVLTDITVEREAREALVRARDDLERQVAARTRELTRTNAGLLAEVDRRSAAEIALSESETRYRQMFESLNSGVFILEPVDQGADFRIRDMNPAVGRITRTRREETLGRRMTEVFPGIVGSPQLAALARVAASGEPEILRGIHYVDALREGWRDFYLYRLASGEVVAILDDVSDRVSAAQAMERAREAAEAASRAKSEFLANMSHEIRTPLNGVLGMLQLLGLTGLSPEQSDYVDTASASGRVLLTVINDILDLSKIEAGKVELASQPFAPREMLRTVTKAFAAQAWSKKVALSWEAAEGLPEDLRGDELRLRQVLYNLVGNAVKFTDQGEVRIETWSLPAGEDRVRFLLLVSDSGPGIPETRLDEVFEPFQQVDGSLRRRFQGTGLGLGIVKRLVRLMGGSLCLESEAGQGTRAWVSVPLGVSRAVRGRERRPGLTATVGLWRLLLVEDNAVNRLVAERFLQDSGHRVDSVDSGAKALEKLGSERYDCVLLDVQMPDMDGLELTRTIRAGVPGPNPADIPLLALTAYALDSDRERILAAGVDAWVPKPVERERLEATLLEVLSRPRAGASS